MALIEVVASGLTIVASITTLLRENMRSESSGELSRVVADVSHRMALIEAALMSTPNDEEAISAAYSGLINTLRNSKMYTSRLQIRQEGDSYRLVFEDVGSRQSSAIPKANSEALSPRSDRTKSLAVGR